MGQAKPMFVPTILAGAPGQKLTITITNKTPGAHNFTLTSQHIDRNIAVGAKETVEVTFPAKGALVFYCEIHYIAEQLFQAGELLVKA
jgi:plastocyanin